MKKVMIIKGAGQDLDKLEEILHEHGLFATELPNDAPALRESLQRSERKYRNLFENAPVGIFRSTPDGAFLCVNPTMARMLKYDSPNELIRTANRAGIAEAIYAEPAHRREIVESVLSRDGWSVREEVFRCRDGSFITCNFHVRAVRGDDGVMELTGFFEDISERKQVENRLRLTQYSVDHACLDVFMVTPGETQILYANEHMCRSLGYSREELLTMTSYDLDPFLTKEKIRDLDRKFFTDGYLPPFEAYHRRKDGTIFPVEISAKRILFEGVDVAICFAQDISERKRGEERLKAALSEKVVLLKELHHRVKNNLQIITSLLDLQSEYIIEEDSKRYVRESQDRIRSMALVHEQLYKSESLSSIHFARYVEELVSSLYRSTMVCGEEKIRVVVDVGDLELEVDQAIPCGLIVNELVTNAFKHAFPADRKGTVLISAKRDTHGMVRLSVSDTGVGLPPDLDFFNTESLGLQIVNLLAKQLRGTLDFRNEGGVSVTICFRAASALPPA